MRSPEELLAAAKAAVFRYRNKPGGAELYASRIRQYYVKNRKKIIRKQIARVRSDPKLRILAQTRTRVWKALKGKQKDTTTLELLGCSREFFAQYLESMWLPNMSWKNYGRNGWHVDHKRPCCTFDLTKPEQMRQCFHYSNLRPLWQNENLTRPRRLWKPELVSA